MTRSLPPCVPLLLKETSFSGVWRFISLQTQYNTTHYNRAVSIPERIHFKVLSLTYNSLQSSQATHLRELFTIQPTRSTRSSSCLTLSRPPVTSHLMFSNRAISITAPRLWNDLPPELRTISLPPPPSLSSSAFSIRHPRAFHSKLKSHL